MTMKMQPKKFTSVLVLCGLFLTIFLLKKAEGMESLLQKIEDPDKTVRQEGMKQVDDLLVSDPQQAVSILVSGLQDENWKIRYYSAARLSSGAYVNGSIASNLSSHVQTLLACLSDTNSVVREYAIKTVSLIQPLPRKGIVTPMMKHLGDPDPKVRNMAVSILGRFPPTKEIRSGILQAFTNEQTSVKGDMAQVLGKMAISDPAAIAALTEALEDTDFYVRQGALNGLMEVGDAAHAATKNVTAILNDKNARPEMRHKAIHTLYAIGQTDPEVAEALAGVLNDADTKLQAIAYLDKMGPSAAVAIPELTRIKDDPEEPVAIRNQAQEVLERLE